MLFRSELSGIWARANMLNKLIYPIDSVAGYMVPPIIRMTIGNILNDQPGYITDINMNLADFPWDIDNEVTNVVELNITFNIIEKNYITQLQNDITNTNNTGYLFAESPISDALRTSGVQVQNQVNTALASVREQIPRVQPIATTTSKTTDSADLHNLQEKIAFGQG